MRILPASFRQAIKVLSESPVELASSATFWSANLAPTVPHLSERTVSPAIGRSLKCPGINAERAQSQRYVSPRLYLLPAYNHLHHPDRKAFMARLYRRGDK